MEELVQIIQEAQGLLICIALVVGGLQCFFGYKLFRVMTAMIGFIVGGVIGGVIGGIVADEGGAILGLLVLGVLGAALAYSLYKLGVFVVCFGAGAMVGLMLATMMDSSDAIPSLMAICGLILGVVGIALTKPAIILSTGIGGGMSMGFAMAGVMEDAGMGIFVGVILAIAGIFVQFYIDKKADGSGNTAAASGAAANRAPASGYKIGSWAVLKTLTADDWTSQQAIYGAIVLGLLGFAMSGCGFTIIIGSMGVLLTIFMILISAAGGASTGACWNKGGREFFHMDEDALKNSKTTRGAAIGAAVGAVVALCMASLLHGHFFGICVCLFCTCFLYGGILGYGLGLRGRYRATYGEPPNAFFIPASSLSPAPEHSVQEAPVQAPAPGHSVQEAPAQAPAPEAPSAPAERSMPAPRFCTNCGQRLEAVARFCPNCGQALPSGKS